MLKFLAIAWSLLCLVAFLYPFAGGDGPPMGSAVRMIQLQNNIVYVFTGWVLGLVALASFRVIFAEPPEPQRERVEPGGGRQSGDSHT